MDLRAHLSEGLCWCIQAMPVNAPIALVIFEAPTFQVKPPGTKFSTIQSQFQPVVAILECCFLLPPLGEERCEHERAGRDCQQGRARGIRPIVKV